MDALSHYHLGQEYAARGGRLLEEMARSQPDDMMFTIAEACAHAQLAQAHAKLALTGVTALRGMHYSGELPPEECSAWFESVAQAAPIAPETDEAEPGDAER